MLTAPVLLQVDVESVPAVTVEADDGDHEKWLTKATSGAALQAFKEPMAAISRAPSAELAAACN
jgi:hypothetical protein